MGESGRLGKKSHASKPAFVVGDGSPQEFRDLGFRKGCELENTAARDQGRIDGEERIFSGGADQQDQPVLNIRQQDVLLGTVEAMYLVEKQHRTPAAGRKAIAGIIEYRPHFLDSHRRRVELLEMASRVLRDHLGQCGLSRAGRAEKDCRGTPVRFQHTPQQFAWAEKMLLADKLLQCPRPHSHRQRRYAVQVLPARLGEEIHTQQHTPTPPNWHWFSADLRASGDSPVDRGQVYRLNIAGHAIAIPAGWRQRWRETQPTPVRARRSQRSWRTRPGRQRSACRLRRRGARARRMD